MSDEWKLITNIAILAFSVVAVLAAMLISDWREHKKILCLIDEYFDRAEAKIKRIRHQRDTLARLVNSGDFDGARELASEILGGEQ